MSCSVYCLVPSPEQIDPLVDRLQRAGVDSRDILVVRRAGESPGSSPARRSADFPASLWSLSLEAAAWWWPLPLQDWPANRWRPSLSGGDAGESEVIPLASYRAMRKAGVR